MPRVDKVSARSFFSQQNQRAIMLFHFMLSESAPQTLKLLNKVLGEKSYKKSAVTFWFNRFRKGNYDITENRGSNRVSGLKDGILTGKIMDAFDQQRTWSIRSLALATGIPYSTCHDIVTIKLKMKKINAKWVPNELSPDQLLTRLIFFRENLELYNQQTDRLSRTITIDETWVSLHPEKDRSQQQDGFGSKVMLIMAMDIKGIFHFNLLPENQALDAEKYHDFLVGVMYRLRGSRKNEVWLLDDNSRSHRNRTINEWMKQNEIKFWLHPPYSPDLSPCDYGCFAHLKKAIGGVAYKNLNSLKKAIFREIEMGNKIGKYKALEKLPQKWRKCVELEGEYISMVL